MKLKKMIGIVLATVLCFVSSITAFAAGITTQEQAILDMLKKGIEIEGIVIELPIEVMNQIENELMKNETDITPEQAEVIFSKINQAIAIAQAENITTAEELLASMDEFLLLVEEAVEAVGYTIEYDIAKGDISVANSSGDTVITTTEVIKQTGFDLTSTAIVGGLTVTLLTACIVIANKKKLFVKTIEL